MTTHQELRKYVMQFTFRSILEKFEGDEDKPFFVCVLNVGYLTNGK
ncbi:MAG: hypothetical protein AABY22_11330 [Nanoarchaeota archaeon]